MIVLAGSLTIGRTARKVVSSEVSKMTISTNLAYQQVRSVSTAVSRPQRGIEWAVGRVKRPFRSQWSRRRSRRWWRREARTYNEMKFKWFPVIDWHGRSYFIDFRRRAFREVDNPHIWFGFDSELGRRMKAEAQRQGAHFLENDISR